MMVRLLQIPTLKTPNLDQQYTTLITWSRPWLPQPLKNSLQRFLFRRAVDQAYQRFAQCYPQWIASLFDDRFVQQQVDSMAQLYQEKGRLLSPLALVVAWDKQVGPASSQTRQSRMTQIYPAAEDFLTWFQMALNASFS